MAKLSSALYSERNGVLSLLFGSASGSRERSRLV